MEKASKNKDIASIPTALGMVNGAGPATSAPALRRGRYDAAVPSRLAIACALLAFCACDAEGWLHLGGVRAFREIGASEARRILEDPSAAVLQLRTAPLEPLLAEAVVLRAGDPLPRRLLEAARILVVSRDGPAGRRLSARLVRAGARRVNLSVGDPVELGARTPALLARPIEP